MRDRLGKNFAISRKSAVLENSGNTMRNVLLHDGTTVGSHITSEPILEIRDTGLLNHAKFETY